MSKLVEIKSRFTGEVLFSCKALNIRACLQIAVGGGANLEGANLEGANLEDAYLEGANLEDANLEGANLEDANLEDAYLKGAYLEDANLKGANLEDAYLKGAYLEDANLEGANLEDAYLKGAYLEDAYLKGAYLKGAYLKGAYLEGANLETIKNDVFSIFDLVGKEEVNGLHTALSNGHVDGSAYEGECCCLVGTLANVKGCTIADAGLTKNSDRPAERFFLGIKRGDTPETNPISKIVVEWIDEYLLRSPSE